MIAADVQGSLECGTFQGISQIIFKAAVECQIILPDIHSRFTQLQITRRESKYRLLNIYRRHVFQNQFHLVQPETSLGLHLFELFFFNHREPASEFQVCLHESVQLHVVQRIDLLHLTQIQLSAGGQMEIRIADRRFHRCIQTERIACQYKIKRSYGYFSGIQRASRIADQSRNIDLFHPGG